MAQKGSHKGKGKATAWAYMPISVINRGSCLNHITCGSNIRKVASITPSKAMFLLLLYYTLARLHRIRSSNFRTACPPEKWYRPCLKGARKVNNRYYILKLKNMRWWSRQSTKIHMVGLIVLTSSSGLSNRLMRCILYLSKQLLHRHISCERMLHLTESIAYGL